MKKQLLVLLAGGFLVLSVQAQQVDKEVSISTAAVRPSGDFTIEKNNPATQVKSQGMTGTCWAFSTISLIESQLINSSVGPIDISEMYTARNIYIDKGKNYILRQGHTQFSEGGLGHDVINAISKYGAMPESAYSGLLASQSSHDHSEMSKVLKEYLDSTLKQTPVDAGWLNGYTSILDKYLGTVPATFVYNNRSYSPASFASQVMKFNEADYVNLTSYSTKPYYKPYIIEVPDNFSNGAYYNLPLQEMLEVVKTAVRKGYTVMWDADVSNNGFRQKRGFALFLDQSRKYPEDKLSISTPEEKWDAAKRQQLIDNLTTQDDHLMHITGIERSKDGKLFFIVKNSWGDVGPFNGYIHVSEAYFAMNTISLVLPRAALSKDLLAKFK